MNVHCGVFFVILGMYGGKNVEFLDWCLKSRHRCGLLKLTLVEQLYDADLGSVVVPMELAKVAVLVSEHALGAIHAELALVEGPAIVHFEPVAIA